MKSAASFYVFEKWKNAPAHAFGSRNQASIIPLEDKEAYTEIFNELCDAAQNIQTDSNFLGKFLIKKTGYSPQFGARGHRPVDLWVSLCGIHSTPLAQMPQIYAIASERGLEVGFAVSIDENDYHDPDVKVRNRLIVPILNSKLPSPTAFFTKELDEKLQSQGGWHYNKKTRLTPSDNGFEEYNSVAELFSTLRKTSNVSGGGTICRLFDLSELSSVDIEQELRLAVKNFNYIIEETSPSSWDLDIIEKQELVHKEREEEFSFTPDNNIDARKKVMAEVSRRQGQPKFRCDLIKAYNGKCAITGTAVLAVLEAAHITPYLGDHTNHVTNGILLRADLHTLFDLSLLRIHPETMTIEIAGSLKDTPYACYNGIRISDTENNKDRPSKAALTQQYATPRISNLKEV